MTLNLDSKIPEGPMADKWNNYIAGQKLVNPSNKRKFKIIVVGTGLAGASAAATFGELGYDVETFTFHDSPRRAHSIAAQGGINAAKNYQGDGDSVHRLFYDTVKGGDFRGREANTHRLAEVSVKIIDQMVAQGVPFAREYGGLLDNRSFGGAQVSRTFYARGQTGQQLIDDLHDTRRGDACWPRARGSRRPSRCRRRAVDRVTVALIVLRCVDAALRRDRVRTARRIVEGEGLDVVAEFTKVAAADAPARPVPTTMILNLRLFDGLTSFWRRCSCSTCPPSDLRGSWNRG